MEKNTRLIGFTKAEVVKALGDDFNFYPSNRWTYFLKKNVWWQNVFLIISFENEVVIKVKHLNTYKKSCP